jgi:riboflavin synthase
LFTGLIEVRGTLRGTERQGPGRRLTIESPGYFGGQAIGASISINGCCLTIVARSEDQADFEAGDETLRRTTMERWSVGDRVNLEAAIRAGNPIGGHFVTGHIDGIGTLLLRHDNGAWSNFVFSAPGPLLRQMAAKGSVAVDGVSLTLVEVAPESFSVALIPHTLAQTTLGALQPGYAVNLETDVLAKYVERQLAVKA